MVTDVNIPIGPKSGRPRGFAFITVTDKEGADKCIANMDNVDLDGRTLQVNIAKNPHERIRRPFNEVSRAASQLTLSIVFLTPSISPSHAFHATLLLQAGNAEVKLYVGNLSFDSDVDAVQELFERYGHVTDCFLPPDHSTGLSRGFGFVTMPAEDARVACEEVARMKLDGRKLRVNEAQPRSQPRGGGGESHGIDGRRYGGGGGGGGRGSYGDGY